MKVRIAALVALLGLLVLGAADAVAQDSEKDKAKAKAKAYETPKEVFDAYVAALNKRDWKTSIGCLAPSAVKRLAGYVARVGVQRRLFAETGGKDGGPNDKLMKSWKDTFEVLDKHGLKAEATKKIKASDSQEAEDALVKLLDDPAAFLIEYQEALDRANPSKTKEPEEKMTLSDVKIDGDKATGTVTLGTKERPEKRPVAFAKVGEGWKLDPSPESDKDKKPAKDQKAKDKDK